jgi:mycothiol synthase
MATDRRMPAVSLRELREDDADQVAELFRVVFGDERHIDAEQVVFWVRNEELDAAWLRVLELGGRIVGYGDIQVTEDEVAVDVAAPMHSEIFFEWAEKSARACGARRVRAFLPAGHELEALVKKRGYRLWRSNYTMEVVLDDSPPQVPRLPMPFQLRRYRADDEDPLRTAINEAFADDPFHHDVTAANFREFYLRARGFDPSLWLLAWDGHELAGFLLAYTERAGEPDLGWIASLGVRPRWRRRGLGEGLLRAALHDLHARGLRRVGLGVDAENATGALRLYRRIGMKVSRQADNWVLDLER